MSGLSWAETVALARWMTDAELIKAAEGCTETTCFYHGPINEVRAERGIR